VRDKIRFFEACKFNDGSIDRESAEPAERQLRTPVNILKVLKPTLCAPRACRGTLPRGIRLHQSLLVSVKEIKARLPTRNNDLITCINLEGMMVSPNVPWLLRNHLLDLLSLGNGPIFVAMTFHDWGPSRYLVCKVAYARSFLICMIPRFVKLYRIKTRCARSTS